MKLIFIHGAGGSPQSYYYQTRHFEGSEAVALPGHPQGTPCKTIPAYAEWLRGYILWQGLRGRGPLRPLHGWPASPSSTPSTIPMSLRASSPSAAAPASAYTPLTSPRTRKASGIPDRGTRPPSTVQPTTLPRSGKSLPVRSWKSAPQVAYNDMTACDQFDIMDRVSEIKLPTLAICGTEDVMTPVVLFQVPGKEPLQLPAPSSSKAQPTASSSNSPDIVNPAIEEFISGPGVARTPAMGRMTGLY